MRDKYVVWSQTVLRVSPGSMHVFRWEKVAQWPPVEGHSVCVGGNNEQTGRCRGGHRARWARGGGREPAGDSRSIMGTCSSSRLKPKLYLFFRIRSSELVYPVSIVLLVKWKNKRMHAYVEHPLKTTLYALFILYHSSIVLLVLWLKQVKNLD